MCDHLTVRAGCLGDAAAMPKSDLHTLKGKNAPMTPKFSMPAAKAALREM